jgi:hypothetical protein
VRASTGDAEMLEDLNGIVRQTRNRRRMKRYWKLSIIKMMQAVVSKSAVS